MKFKKSESDIPRSKQRIILTYFLVIAVALWSLFPIGNAFRISLMSESELSAVPIHWYPHEIDLRSYGMIFGKTFEGVEYWGVSPTEMLNSVFSSLAVAVPTMIIATLIAIFAAYPLGRLKFKFKTTIFVTLLFSRILPPVALVIPFYFIFSRIGLVGNPLGLIITYLSGIIPLATWILMGYFAQLPAEVEWAARMDGYGRFATLRRVLIPMALPGIAVVAILSFLMAWNEFFFAFILTTGSSAATFPVMLLTQVTIFAPQNLMLAGVMLSLIPPVILALIFQRYITRLHIVDPVTVQNE